MVEEGRAHGFNVADNIALTNWLKVSGLDKATRGSLKVMCAPHSTLKAYKVIIKQALEAEELFEGGVPAVKATQAGGRTQGGSKSSEADRSQGGRRGNHNKRKANHSPDPDGRSHSKSVFRRVLGMSRVTQALSQNRMEVSMVMLDNLTAQS
eukprot:jgi/Mesvir1/24966/Mv16936-RA.1